MDLSTLVSDSQALTAHLAPSDLPSIQLGFEQIEAQSRRLVARQPTAAIDSGKASYLLAQAQVDTGTLADNIATLNPASTFAPRQPLHDTDVSGYLRHAHEQGIISTIEEGRRETQLEFQRVLDERVRRDWEARKKRIFEELGERTTLLPESRQATRGFAGRGPSHQAVVEQQQPRMLVYDSIITHFNSARLANSAFPLLRHLVDANEQISPALVQTYELLASIVREPQGLPPLEHPAAHLTNAPIMERKYARAYLGPENSPEATNLRRRVASGAREALEAQYWDVVSRTIAARPQHAALGGDPSVSSHIRAFLNVKFYQAGSWEERLELIAGQPIWAKLFYLIRTGHVEDALEEALKYEAQINAKERNFITYMKAWVQSSDRQLSKSERNQLQATYNSHILHSPTTDPFKLALFKVIGKLDPSRRTVPLVTATTEDWLWFQLAMLDEGENGGLRALGDVLMGYGERHFEGTPTQRTGKRGMWARVLLTCGQFERAVAALYEVPEFQIDAVHLAISLAYYGLLRVPSRVESSDVDIVTTTSSGQPTLNLALLISRYIRQFLRVDPKIALQYVYTVCLSGDQPTVGKEQIEIAWELCRRVILLAEANGGWEDLVGGFRPDGSRFMGMIERDKRLLRLREEPTAGVSDYTDQILLRAAKQSERDKRTNEAIKLYYLANAHDTVVACLAQALSDYVGEADGGGEAGDNLTLTAREILQHYERTNKGAGKSRDAVIKLVKIREARDARVAGQLEKALELIESTHIFPAENDVTAINQRVQALRDYDDTIVRNLQIFLPLQMDILVELSNRRRAAYDAATRNANKILVEKAVALQKFATIVKYSMSPDVHTYLSRSVVNMKN